MKPILIFKSGIHLGEEKVVQGNRSSGMIYFSGCHLACNFCYTPETSVLKQGQIYSALAFSALLEELVTRGAHNINLISPTHLWPALDGPLQQWRARYGGIMPLVLKISGFETAAVLHRMKETADIFVPDFKVFGGREAKLVALPESYGRVAMRAIAQLMRTHGAVSNVEGELSRGILVRHLLMPGFFEDSLRVVEALGEIGFQQKLNLMTYFVDVTNRRVSNANPREVTLLRLKAESLGMTVLVNGKACALPQVEAAHG